MDTAVALINTSKSLQATPDVLGKIAAALDLQGKQDFCPDWGLAPWGCTYFNDLSCACPQRIFLFDTPDVANALGYHDVDPATGLPFGRVFLTPILSNGGTLLDGPNSLSVTASHEYLELMGDADANLMVTMPDGRLTAREACDAVEDISYGKTLADGTIVAVSNYLQLEWFNGASKGSAPAFDKMGLLSGPFLRTSGGYMILETGGQITQEFGLSMPAWKRELKTHPTHSRYARIVRKLRERALLAPRPFSHDE